MESKIIESILKSLQKRGLLTSAEVKRIYKKVSN